MITLNTILYEGNFRQHLNENSWYFKFNSKFDIKRRLTINNLTSIDEFNFLLSKIKDYLNIEIVKVIDYEKEANIFFNTNMNDSSIGYNYAIPYFVTILTCNTPYILNVSSDFFFDINLTDNYIEKSIELFKQDNLYPVTTLPCNKHWSVIGVPEGIPNNVSCVGEWEQINAFNFNKGKELKNFWCSDVFCDQIFMGDVEKLKKVDYSINGNAIHQPRPPYGGYNSFESRLADYLASNGMFRPIFKSEVDYYIHSGHLPNSNIK